MAIEENCLILLLNLLFSLSAFAKGGHHKVAPAPKPFPSNKAHMTKVGSCSPKEGSTKKVYILKQWHLSPKTVTKGFKEKYPQEKNQTAIYHLLEDGVKRKELQLIVAEGCEGEINASFVTSFNGWDYSSLKAQCLQKNYDRIITLQPLKVEAKYGDKINTLCGDNDELVREGLLRISNLRGWEGFYTRLSESSADAEKIKLYSEGAADLLKVPKDTPVDKLLPLIKDRIKSELQAFYKSLDDRNTSFVKVLQDHEFSKAAVVVGGLHAKDLKEKIDKAGMNCEVLEPPGYQRESESLIQDFEKALN